MSPHSRVQSLDALRGLALAAMIVVTGPGDYRCMWPTLGHSDWNGCTFADLVFPFFLVIVGVAMPFAFQRRRGRDGQVSWLRRLGRRTAALLALGLLLNVVAVLPHVHWDTLRIPGVLQRIALVSLLGGLITLRFRTRTHVALAGGLLLVYWLLLSFVPVPGHGIGGLGPDGNLAGFVDRWVLRGHMLWPDGDPEGILSTLPALATTLIGCVAGAWILRGRGLRSVVTGLASSGATLVIVGLLWSTILPLNKPIWSSSFALFTAGVALVWLATFYWLIDLRGMHHGLRPLLVLGANPITTYFLSTCVNEALERIWVGSADELQTLKAWLFDHCFLTWADSTIGCEAASLLYSLTWLAIWTVLADQLYRRRIFIRF